ncbi:MAG: lycopene cyclase domain-containing protein [Candidatus Pacebacteria bacterium]|nr:lycopene cyclase domain-containing protein [Candidatus Paceibacterota bacterium]
MKIEYLVFNFLVFSLSGLGVGLYPGAVWPKLKPALGSILAIGLPYVIWDQLVAEKWWWFNRTYILGWYWGKLPLEEVLFFLIVPWSCLVIWVNLKQLVKGGVSWPIEWLLIVFGILAAFGFYSRELVYSLTVSLLLVGFGLVSLLGKKWLRSQATLIFLGLVVILTLVFNGYLTARPIVIYNSDVMINWRIGTVPFEDVVYGLVLVGGVVRVYEWLIKLRERHLVP